MIECSERTSCESHHDPSGAGRDVRSRRRAWPRGLLQGADRAGSVNTRLQVLSRSDMGSAIVDLIQSGGGVMTLEDLAECDAEVIEPIKYDFKHTHGPESGVTLWEVYHPTCSRFWSSSL